MAFSVNILSQNQTLIPLDFPPLKLRNPRILFKSLSPMRNVCSQKRISISASATKVATDVDAQGKISESLSRWEEFTRNVSGEWDGFGADFTSEGKPIELPESIVPEEFREWEVKVFDWQIQCSTLAETDEPVLVYKLIKLLPTVGCEADAATRYSINERSIGGINNKVSAFAYHPSGCYVAVWPVEDREAYRLLELEHCLVDPQNRESRVRIIQVFRLENTMMKLQNIKVFCEQWYGPFRNGEQLGGCSIRDSGFASTEVVKLSEVIGVWQGTSTVASFHGPRRIIFQELVDENPRSLMRDQHGLTLLPKQLWCSLEEREDGESWAEVGWLLDSGRALTSRCIFLKDGKLEEIAIGHETSTSEGV
ncbi:uncharacterized protein LOC131243137 [Magnolia sinica]|uniref:uncharacterized protein LOC131243137 n=1 Tax=Magnolia sinica TaxID=86752 RepID=UPI002657F01E|nr:uncharacterized protein LOC131243137 [Magnolia sinica]